MSIRPFFKEAFAKKFNTESERLEEACYKRSYNFCVEKGVSLDWNNIFFKNCYYQTCVEILNVCDDPLTETKFILKGRLDHINKSLSKYKNVATQLIEERTIDNFCRKCQKITKNFTKCAQTRSSDESKTIIYRCKSCQFIYYE